MNHELIAAATRLAKGSLHAVANGRGTWVQCLEGALWLTQQGEPRDVVIEAGAEAMIERDGSSILSALADSRFVMLRPEPAAIAAAAASHRGVRAAPE